VSRHTDQQFDREVEARIDEFLDQNLAELQADRGHALAPQVRETARKQVKLYWRRLRDIAKKVTDTEVRLGLTGEATPAGRPFAIEGIVDIVRDERRTVLYDVKTHAEEAIRANLSDYQAQLNVYAHIWQTLRGESLDETAIICTECPPGVLAAFDEGDEARLERTLGEWHPVIPVEFDPQDVKKTIRAFAEVVDRIEDHDFDPRPVADLKRKEPGLRTVFAVAVCRNCDARFSCDSYRRYALVSRRAQESAFKAYIEDLGDDELKEEFLLAALETADQGTPDELL